MANFTEFDEKDYLFASHNIVGLANLAVASWPACLIELCMVTMESKISVSSAKTSQSW